jgi:hypothetical protein
VNPRSSSAGVQPGRVHHHGLQLEPVGEPGHRGQRGHRVAAGFGVLGPAAPGLGGEQVVGHADAGGTGVDEIGHGVAQPGPVRGRGELGQLDEDLHRRSRPAVQAARTVLSRNSFGRECRSREEMARDTD